MIKEFKKKDEISKKGLLSIGLTLAAGLVFSLVIHICYDRSIGYFNGWLIVALLIGLPILFDKRYYKDRYVLRIEEERIVFHSPVVDDIASFSMSAIRTIEIQEKNRIMVIFKNGDYFCIKDHFLTENAINSLIGLYNKSSHSAN